MRHKIFFTFLILSSIMFTAPFAYADRDCETIGVSDYNTFKEYCYKVTDAYLDFRNNYEVNEVIDSYSANKILDYATSGLKYLPDSLSNKNYYNQLKTAIEKGVKDPEDPTIFTQIKSTTESFLRKTTVQEITGKISANPVTGNAPLTVTLRADVKDPTGTKLENYNYTWWIQDGKKRRILGNRVFLNYTFREEGNYAVFLDVTSNHRNKQGNVDVLSFSDKVVITVKEKVASTIIRVNSKSLGGGDFIKFSPEEGDYGLLIDATSSTPASGTKFVATQWDFGNGVTEAYDGPPKVERVIYAVEGEYNVKLKMTTNSGSVVERNFTIVVRNPIASIKASSFDGFLGDKFTFSANTYVKNDNLTYAWEIVDLKKDAIIFNKGASTFSYNFPEKGRYNVKLTVTAPSGEMDYDNRIVYINSRPPVASFSHEIRNMTQPNVVFFDGGDSYDLDATDAGKLEYNWIIDGERVDLDDASNDGASGYYTFSSIGNHDVVLEVLDPDDMMAQKSRKVNINSILGVNFYTFPRVTQVGAIVKFVPDAPEAEYYEWNFGDGGVDGGKNGQVTHKYKQAGVYNVSLTVTDANENRNTIMKKVYVGDSDTPYAFINIANGKTPYGFQKDVCQGKGGYVVDRISNIGISASESLDVTGLTKGLTYSWKIGNKYYTDAKVSKRFDELGCIPIKLTVRSQKTGKTAIAETFLDVRNIKPTLSSLDIQVKDPASDPVVVKVTAVGAKDEDGIIQSYLWYYYTDNSSEPQDFRATRSNSTTFVLPKITGNYYFVVVMKDNNEERVKSEDITSRYFITLAGDNQNTPIVDLRVSDTSVAVGEEVTFTVSAKNILTQNILKDSKVYWDFDGDGFYDKQSKSPTVTHKYTEVGENINAKVKVSHKGFSNTRSVQINVSNILKPSFNYISIGNEVLLFDTSSGSIDSYTWDMGDGNTVTNNGSFKYTYKDGKNAHNVQLTIKGGGEKKTVQQEVVRNFKNFIDAKKQEVALYSELFNNSNGLNTNETDGKSITISESKKFISLYIRTNKAAAKNYAIDYDVSSDSDLNGGDADDIDNKDDESFYSGGPVNIPLNASKKQEIGITILDEAGNTIASKNIVLNKEYIEEAELDPSTITFEGVPDSVKTKFEQIKEKVLLFPKEYKLKSLEYIQRLQEEWNDNRAKTQIILEFEGFIADNKLDTSGDLINLLESLLVDAENEKEGNEIAANALKNLLPKSITCPESLQSELTAQKICYDILTEKIEAIKNSSDSEINKQLAKDILGAVADDDVMTPNEKLDFKQILKTLSYWGLENVPEEELSPETGVGDVSDAHNNKKSGGAIAILVTVLKWLFFIILGIATIVGIFYVIYKLLNSDGNTSFTEFISEKTARSQKSITNKQVEDVLGTDATEKGEEKYDPLADFSSDASETEEAQQIQAPEKIDWGEVNTQKKQGDSTEKATTPDWMTSSSIEAEKKETATKAESVEIPKTENKGSIPSWLKGSLDETPSTVETEKKTDSLEIKPKEKTSKTTETTQTENKQNNVPAWLQGSLDEGEKKSKEKIEEKEEINTTKSNVEAGAIPEVAEAQDIDKKKDEELLMTSGVPDWLKGTDVEVEQPETPKTKKVQKKETQKPKEKNDAITTEKSIPEKKTESGSTKKKGKNKEEPKLDTKEELEDFIAIKDDDIEVKDNSEKKLPDWLTTDTKQANTAEKKKQNTVKKDTATEGQVVTKIEDSTTEGTSTEPKVADVKVKKVPAKKKAPKLSTNKKATNAKKDAVKNEEKSFNDFDFATTKGTKKFTNKTSTPIKQNKAESKKQEKKDKNDELWDDGMNIPDWLKTD